MKVRLKHSSSLMCEAGVERIIINAGLIANQTRNLLRARICTRTGEITAHAFLLSAGEIRKNSVLALDDTELPRFEREHSHNQTGWRR